jgi:hypothetical protein
MSLNQPSWPYILLRAWITIWMLAVPLFHVHPESDHHHGEAGHSHGGTVHTVFSPDLDGEFEPHHDTTQNHGTPHNTDQTSFAAHPAHALDYAELGFSFVSDSTDRSLPKPLVTAAFLIQPPAHLAVTAIHSASLDLTVSQSFTLFAHDIPARAPPSLLV